MPDAAGWLLLSIGAIVGSTIGGVAGFGTGVITIPAIAWALGAKATVPVLTVAMLLGNGARVWFSRGEVDGRVVAAFLAGAIPSGIAGAVLYSRVESEWISRILGTFMLVAVPARRWLSRHGVWIRLRHFPAVGAAFGFLSSLVGAVGPITSPFFLGYGLRKGAYIATDALCSVGMYVVRGFVFRRYDLMTGPTIAVGLYMGLIMIGGAYIGRRLLDRMSERTFLRIIEALLLVFGIQFILWPAR
jgi:uncharacterized membrane protein YfcA